MKKLPRAFYNRDTALVAKELLGKVIVHRTEGVRRIGRIVEVEAYVGPHDLASHSAKGLTQRTRIMFGPPGHAYVYLIYGMYHCMNVVTEPAGKGAAILLRAIEPLQNINQRSRGPGLLCQALQITRDLNGEDLLGNTLFLATDGHVPNKIVKRPRIGVDYAGNWAKRHLRFYLKNNSFVSRR